MVHVVTSGGFDPLHAGHVQLFNEARKLGDRLTVLIMSDEWLMRKKGYVFMPFEDRSFIIACIRSVDEVIEIPNGKSVIPWLSEIKPNIYAKGGDRNRDNMPAEEIEICDHYGIEIIDGVGGGKIRSSSELVHDAVKQIVSKALLLDGR